MLLLHTLGIVLRDRKGRIDKYHNSFKHLVQDCAYIIVKFDDCFSAITYCDPFSFTTDVNGSSFCSGPSHSFIASVVVLPDHSKA